MIAAAPMGDPNASIPTPQPVHYRPMFGAFGGALRATSLTFVSQAALDGRRRRAARPAQARWSRCSGTPHASRKRDMIHNDCAAEDRGRPADLRGARRRRAADLRAGDACCRWRSAISCSESRQMQPMAKMLRFTEAMHHGQARGRRRDLLTLAVRSSASAAGCAIARLDDGREAALHPAARDAAARRRPAAVADDGEVGRVVRAADETLSRVQRRVTPSRSRAPPTTSATGTCRCRSAPAGCATSTITCSTTCCAELGADGRDDASRRSSPRRAPTGTAASGHHHGACDMITSTTRHRCTKPGDAPATTDVVRDHGVALTRLLQLVSPALPVGAFAYSQGLEPAVARGWVHRRGDRGGLAASTCSSTSLARSTCRCCAPASTPGARTTDARSTRWNAWLRGLPRDARDCAPRTAQLGACAGARCSRDRRARRRRLARRARPSRHGGDVRAGDARAARSRRSRATGLRCSPGPRTRYQRRGEGSCRSGQSAGQRAARALRRRDPERCRARARRSTTTSSARRAPGHALASALHETPVHAGLFRS